MMAELERDLISLRTKEALASKKARGMILGKPKGTIQRSIYDSHKEAIKKLLERKIPVTYIGRIINVGKPASLHNYVKKHKLNVY